MEDDNNKQRKAARREFQDNVRALVAFVRKRDVRVIAWMEQEVVKKAEHKAAEARRLGLLRCTLHAKLSRLRTHPCCCCLAVFSTMECHSSVLSSL